MNRNFTIFIVLLVLALVGWMLMRNGTLPFFSNNQAESEAVIEPADNDIEPVEVEISEV
jgi:hypothetical protein